MVLLFYFVVLLQITSPRQCAWRLEPVWAGARHLLSLHDIVRLACCVPWTSWMLRGGPRGTLVWQAAWERDNVMSRFPLGSPPGISNFSDKSVGQEVPMYEGSECWWAISRESWISSHLRQAAMPVHHLRWQMWMMVAGGHDLLCVAQGSLPRLHDDHASLVLHMFTS